MRRQSDQEGHPFRIEPNRLIGSTDAGRIPAGIPHTELRARHSVGVRPLAVRVVHGMYGEELECVRSVQKQHLHDDGRVGRVGPKTGRKQHRTPAEPIPQLDQRDVVVLGGGVVRGMFQSCSDSVQVRCVVVGNYLGRIISKAACRGKNHFFVQY